MGFVPEIIPPATGAAIKSKTLVIIITKLTALSGKRATSVKNNEKYVLLTVDKNPSPISAAPQNLNFLSFIITPIMLSELSAPNWDGQFKVNDFNLFNYFSAFEARALPVYVSLMNNSATNAITKSAAAV